MDRARIFRTSRSQAVCLPERYRFAGDEVQIRRIGDAVILEPIPSDWDWLAAVTGPSDPDFVAAMLDNPAKAAAF